MTRSLSLSVALPLFAPLILALAAPTASAQTRQGPYRAQPAQARSFDGFCYVRENSVRAETETDYWGTRRGYGRCYRGEYYVFAGRYTTPPRPPEGYVARYFTRRPDQAFYDRVYNARTLTENFEPEARYDDRGYSRYDQRRDDESVYENGRDETGRYNGRRYDEYPAEETYPAPPPAPSYNTRREDAEDYSDDQATVGRYETRAPSDDYARDSHAPDENGYVAPYDARQTYDEVDGWRDDQGSWHVGRPVAIGWQDAQGQWHEGQVQDYGRRDRYGEWHVVRDGGE